MELFLLSAMQGGYPIPPPPPPLPFWDGSLRLAQAPIDADIIANADTLFDQAETAGLGITGIRHNLLMTKTYVIARDFSSLDPQWTAMQARGLALYLTAFDGGAGGPYPGDDPNPTTAAAERTAWAAIVLDAVQYIASTYPGLLKVLEVWNEGDGSWPIPADKLVLLTAAVKIAIRSDTSLDHIPIAGPATVVDEGAYWQTLIDEGLIDHVDWISHHFYTAPETFETRMAALRAKLAQVGGESKPIVISEWGGKGSSEAGRVHEIASGLTMLRLAGLRSALYFPLRDYATFPNNGLLNSDGSLAEQGTVWNTWSDNIGDDAIYIERESLASNIHCHHFTVSVGVSTLPVARNESAGPFTVGTGIKILNPLANDTYASSPSLSIISQTAGLGATVTGSGAASMIQFNSNGQSATAKTITYQLTDDGGSDQATISFTIVALSLPVAQNDTAGPFTVGTGIKILDPLDNDTFDEASVVLSIVSQTAGLGATVTGSGAASMIQFNSAGQSATAKTITYQVTDVGGSDQATISFTIVALPLPVAQNDTAGPFTVGTGIKILDPLDNDTFDEASVGLSIVSQTAGLGATVTGSGTASRIQFNSAGQSATAKTITYQVTDVGGNDQATISFTIVALPLPVAQNDTAGPFTVGTGIKILDPLDNDTFDEASVVLSIVSQTAGLGATVTGSGAASMIQFNSNGQSLTAKTITYQVTDVGGSDQATITFSIVAASAFWAGSLRLSQAPIDADIFSPSVLTQAASAGLGIAGIRHNLLMTKSYVIAGDYSLYDPQWAALEAAGLTLYLCLFDGGSGGPYPGDDPNPTTAANERTVWAARAVNALLYIKATYPDLRVVAELWNEGDQNPDSSWPFPAAAYTLLAAVLYPAMRARPELDGVALCGPASVQAPGGHWQRLIDAGLFGDGAGSPPLLDFVSHHIYSAPHLYEANLDSLRAKLAQVGAENLPIVMSEWGGYGTANAYQVASGLTMLKALGVLGASYFTLRDYPGVFANAGLMNADGTIDTKGTIWNAWHANVGDGATYVGRDSGLPLNVQSRHFTVSGSHVRVVWASSGAPSINVAGSYTAEDANGGSIAAGGAHVLGGSPIYIFGAVTIALTTGADALLASNVDQFSLVQGQDGWTYQWLTGGVYTNAAVDLANNDWARPGSTFWQINASHQQSAASAGVPVYAVRKWVVPAGVSRVKVSGTWARGSGGDGSDVTLLRNSTVRFRRGAMIGVSATILQIFDVIPGDVLEFRAGPGPAVETSFDDTTLNIVIYSTTSAVNTVDNDTASLSALGDPNTAHSINTGLQMFVGGHPLGATEVGTERISRNGLSYIGGLGNPNRVDPDRAGWRVPEVTSTNGGIHFIRPSTFNAAVGATNRFALWMDVILDTTEAWSFFFSIPWRDIGWSPPYTVISLGRESATNGLQFNFINQASAQVGIGSDDIPGGFPATGRHRFGVVRDGDNVHFVYDGTQLGATKTGAGTDFPNLTGSSKPNKPLVLLGRSDTAADQGIDGAVIQMRFWTIPGGTTAANMIARMATLQSAPDTGRHIV